MIAKTIAVAVEDAVPFRRRGLPTAGCEWDVGSVGRITFNAWNGAQILEDCAKVMVGHV